MTSELSIEAEKRLLTVESSVQMLKERSEINAADMKVNNRILQELEKTNVEIKSSITAVLGMVSDIRKDFDSLEKHTESSQERHSEDLKEFADTVVSALNDVSTSFKDVVMTATKALESKVESLQSSQERVNKALDDRLKSLEQFYWKVTGACGILGAVLGSMIPYLVKTLTAGKS